MTPGDRGREITDILLSNWPLHWGMSCTGGTSVTKLGRGVTSVPGMTLPSLKGGFEEELGFRCAPTPLSMKERGSRAFSGSRSLFRISLDSVDSDAIVASAASERRRRPPSLVFVGDMASESIDAVMSRLVGCT